MYLFHVFGLQEVGLFIVMQDEYDKEYSYDLHFYVCRWKIANAYLGTVFFATSVLISGRV